MNLKKQFFQSLSFAGFTVTRLAMISLFFSFLFSDFSFAEEKKQTQQVSSQAEEQASQVGSSAKKQASQVGSSAKKQASERRSQAKKQASLSDFFQKAGTGVDVVADQVEYDKEHQAVIAKGNVVVTYGDVKITSDYAEVATQSKKATAKGNVVIFKGDSQAAKGDVVQYDFENNTGSFPNAKLISEPWTGHGEDIQQLSKEEIQVHHGSISTCNLDHPHYSIHAKKTTILTGNKIVARNVTIKVLGKPVFWLPYLSIPLQGEHAPFTLSPGYNSEDGAYVKTTKGFSINKHLFGKLLADWRSKRGFGAGAQLQYEYGPLARGEIIGYWTQDDRAPTPSLTNPFTELEDRDRGRLTWKHRSDFDEHTHLIARYHRIADELFLRDFFQKEDRLADQQTSFVALTKNTEKWGLLVHATKQMNSFESIVERLPQIRLDWKNQAFLTPWLFYESRFDFDNLAKRFSRSDATEDTVRVDSFHEWVAPFQWQGVKFNPFLNVRGTYYSRDADGDENRFRTAVGFGTDARMHFYKTYDAQFDTWGVEVNQLRHIIEPSIRIESVHPATIRRNELDRFDNIDTIDDQDVITFGLENRLQTKRMVYGQMQRVDLVSLNTFLQYEFHPSTGRHSSSNLKDLTTEIVLRPYNWLQYETRFTYNLERDQLEVVNQDLIAATKRFRFLIGHRFIKDPQLINSATALDTSNLVVLETRYKLNPLWQLGGYVRWDADDKELEEWQVVATRDLHDWILDIGYNVRDTVTSSSDKEIYFNLRLKNYPEFALRGGSRATFADPRIGETVAGANEFNRLSESI